jgi:hypothetical protein
VHDYNEGLGKILIVQSLLLFANGTQKCFSWPLVTRHVWNSRKCLKCRIWKFCRIHSKSLQFCRFLKYCISKLFKFSDFQRKNYISNWKLIRTLWRFYLEK